MQEMFCEVCFVLLEVDVLLLVVCEFIVKVKEKVFGEEVISSLLLGQVFVGVVQKELIVVIGGDYEGKVVELNFVVMLFVVILMVGLQGVGKIMIVGKFVKLLCEKYKKKVLIVLCDVYCLVVIMQLKMVIEQVGVDFFLFMLDQKFVDIVFVVVDWVKCYYYDVLFVDMVGCFGIDEVMMQEIVVLYGMLKLVEMLFVVDVMFGQDVVNIVKVFNDMLLFIGVVLIKFDGDLCGGVVLLVCYVMGKLIKFVGVVEKFDGFEVFYFDWMVNWIFGMGDIFVFVEEVQCGVDVQVVQKFVDKVKKGGDFDLNDFCVQILQMKNMGGLLLLMDKFFVQFQQVVVGVDMGQVEKLICWMEGIISLMMFVECVKFEIIKVMCKCCIVVGVGVLVQEVNWMLNQYDQMCMMMKKLKGGNMQKMMCGLKGMMFGMC